MLLRKARDVFCFEHLATIGVDFVLADVDLPGTSIKLQIWDVRGARRVCASAADMHVQTAGQERFRAISNSFYRGAHAVVVVVDMTCVDSWSSAASFVSDAQRLSPPGSPIFLCGSKADALCSFSSHDLEELARSLGVKSAGVCSAKANTGITELFETVAKACVEASASRLHDLVDNKSAVDKNMLGGRRVLEDKVTAGCCAIL